jgi:hypothetical protein
MNCIVDYAEKVGNSPHHGSEILYVNSIQSPKSGALTCVEGVSTGLSHILSGKLLICVSGFESLPPSQYLCGSRENPL